MTSEIPNSYYRISVKALILDESRTKFLILEEENHKYDFPGGGLDFGETPQDCIVRELKEECGIIATSVASSPSHFITFKHDQKGDWRINIFYETTVASLDFTPSEECIAVKFVSPEEVKNLDVYSSVTKFAEQFEKSLKK